MIMTQLVANDFYILAVMAVAIGAIGTPVVIATVLAILRLRKKYDATKK